MMRSDQLQAAGNKSLAGTGAIASSSYLDPVRAFFQSIDGFVGVYYDTLFLLATFIGVITTTVFYYKSYKQKVKKYERQQERHDLELAIMRKTGELINTDSS